ncbi:MAG: FtsQ-type POTRA domain-containing protein [Deltaproteobacteria bacterium]
MPKMLKANYEARMSRLRRRVVGSIGEYLGALGLLIAIAALSFLFIYAYSYFLSTPYLEVKETSVRGLKELTEKDILLLAEIKPGQNILAVNVDVLAKRVAVNPWIKSVYVGREFPCRIVVDVRERTPLALVKQASDFYLMDSYGIIFKKLVKGDEVDLPIITGINVQDTTKSKLLSDTISLLKVFSGSNLYSFLGGISEAHIDEVFGLSLLTDKGLYMKMGVDDFEKKLRKLALVLNDREKRGINSIYLNVDLADAAKITISQNNALGRTQPNKNGKQYMI